MTRIRELLEVGGCRVSYPSLRRFILKRHWQRRSKTTVRMEDSAPGEVAEVDFGRLGMITDPETGRRRTVWALIIVLGYSRHSLVWPTHGQTLEDIIAGLEAAWVFFGGIPRYLVIDNCPPAVAGPDPLHPRFTRGFLEYSQHRGFIADAARVRRPKDKPKVERGVQYVRERFCKGSDFNGLGHVRSEARRWCIKVAGQRTHGTTRRLPLVVFQEEERHTLLPWDGEPYDIADWRSACLSSWSKSLNSCSNHAMWVSMRGRTAPMAVPSRFFSETSMVSTWRRRAVSELRTWVSASLRGRTEGRTASAK